MNDEARRLWEENEDFLRGNGIGSLDDSAGFHAAMDGWESVISETYDQIREHYSPELEFDLDEYSENLRRLEDIWNEACSCDAI